METLEEGKQFSPTSVSAGGSTSSGMEIGDRHSGHGHGGGWWRDMAISMHLRSEVVAGWGEGIEYTGVKG